MAEVNVQKRPASSRTESQSLAKRYDPFSMRGYPSVWRSPFEFLSSSPFGMMRRFGEDVDRLFPGWSTLAERDGADGWWPAIDIGEKNGKLSVRADLPGIDKNDVKVEFTDGMLTISGERKREHEEESGGIRRTERSYGNFYRTIPLPEGANADQAHASFKDG
ncbi:MAG TPA: Hsp20/alpha crystallin family protein, partial [Bryobacteraceae bacterium]|nr:Hsp20/alpha crystallin family protein [Bryobacteraceae bacterium]